MMSGAPQFPKFGADADFRAGPFPPQFPAEFGARRPAQLLASLKEVDRLAETSAGIATLRAWLIREANETEGGRGGRGVLDLALAATVRDALVRYMIGGVIWTDVNRSLNLEEKEARTWTLSKLLDAFERPAAGSGSLIAFEFASHFLLELDKRFAESKGTFEEFELPSRVWRARGQVKMFLAAACRGVAGWAPTSEKSRDILLSALCNAVHTSFMASWMSPCASRKVAASVDLTTVTLAEAFLAAAAPFLHDDDGQPGAGSAEAASLAGATSLSLAAGLAVAPAAAPPPPCGGRAAGAATPADMAGSSALPSASSSSSSSSATPAAAQGGEEHAAMSAVARQTARRLSRDVEVTMMRSCVISMEKASQWAMQYLMHNPCVNSVCTKEIALMTQIAIAAAQCVSVRITTEALGFHEELLQGPRKAVRQVRQSVYDGPSTLVLAMQTLVVALYLVHLCRRVFATGLEPGRLPNFSRIVAVMSARPRDVVDAVVAQGRLVENLGWEDDLTYELIYFLFELDEAIAPFAQNGHPDSGACAEKDALLRKGCVAVELTTMLIGSARWTLTPPLSPQGIMADLFAKRWSESDVIADALIDSDTGAIVQSVLLKWLQQILAADSDVEVAITKYDDFVAARAGMRYLDRVRSDRVLREDETMALAARVAHARALQEAKAGAPPAATPPLVRKSVDDSTMSEDLSSKRQLTDSGDFSSRARGQGPASSHPVRHVFRTLAEIATTLARLQRTLKALIRVQPEVVASQLRVILRLAGRVVDGYMLSRHSSLCELDAANAAEREWVRGERKAHGLLEDKHGDAGEEDNEEEGEVEEHSDEDDALDLSGAEDEDAVDGPFGPVSDEEAGPGEEGRDCRGEPGAREDCV